MSTEQLYRHVANEAFAVTPSDSTVIAFTYLYVGTGGDVTVTTVHGETVTYKNVYSGGYVWVRGTQVKSTGTNAADIVGHR